eukprot:sb/3467050/
MGKRANGTPSGQLFQCGVGDCTYGHDGGRRVKPNNDPHEAKHLGKTPPEQPIWHPYLGTSEGKPIKHQRLDNFAIPKPAAKNPAAKNPAAKEPAAKKPAVKEPAAKKPAAKNPAANEPVDKENVPEMSMQDEDDDDGNSGEEDIQEDAQYDSQAIAAINKNIAEIKGMLGKDSERIEEALAEMSKQVASMKLQKSRPGASTSTTQPPESETTDHTRVKLCETVDELEKFGFIYDKEAGKLRCKFCPSKNGYKWCLDDSTRGEDKKRSPKWSNILHSITDHIKKDDHVSKVIQFMAKVVAQKHFRTDSMFENK